MEGEREGLGVAQLRLTACCSLCLVGYLWLGEEEGEEGEEGRCWGSDSE